MPPKAIALVVSLASQRGVAPRGHSQHPLLPGPLSFLALQPL
jgi:hypothetical protein